MVDPLSALGITIAIVDDLLRLGERTAEFVSDVRQGELLQTRRRNTIG